jgi:hypothetical protein
MAVGLSSARLERYVSCPRHGEFRCSFSQLVVGLFVVCHIRTGLNAFGAAFGQKYVSLSVKTSKNINRFA